MKNWLLFLNNVIGWSPLLLLFLYSHCQSSSCIKKIWFNTLLREEVSGSWFIWVKLFNWSWMKTPPAFLMQGKTKSRSFAAEIRDASLSTLKWSLSVNPRWEEFSLKAYNIIIILHYYNQVKISKLCKQIQFPICWSLLRLNIDVNVALNKRRCAQVSVMLKQTSVHFTGMFCGKQKEKVSNYVVEEKHDSWYILFSFPYNRNMDLYSAPFCHVVYWDSSAGCNYRHNTVSNHFRGFLKMIAGVEQGSMGTVTEEGRWLLWRSWNISDSILSGRREEVSVWGEAAVSGGGEQSYRCWVWPSRKAVWLMEWRVIGGGL